MKFRFGKKQLALLVACLVVVAAVGIGIYLSTPKEIKHYNFYGTQIAFRDDLRNAKNISVYPDDKAIQAAVWNPDLKNITIAFVNSSDNNLMAVDSFEITYKMSIAYNKFDWFINFNGKEVGSFGNLTGTKDNLVIALVPPSIANETKVEMKDNVIYIKGKTPVDFDRATIRFIMSALNITV
ncbi:MAG: hypothetical protein HYW23_04370 [Candidatus Aenigmarchaeota archaeon]|nr:hypothetical protein [Candidatus Aenigmarchaeota archaeon]